MDIEKRMPRAQVNVVKPLKSLDTQRPPQPQPLVDGMHEGSMHDRIATLTTVGQMASIHAERRREAGLTCMSQTLHQVISSWRLSPHLQADTMPNLCIGSNMPCIFATGEAQARVGAAWQALLY
eukprot:2566559-Amphidinium_carterae.1